MNQWYNKILKRSVNYVWTNTIPPSAWIVHTSDLFIKRTLVNRSRGTILDISSRITPASWNFTGKCRPNIYTKFVKLSKICWSKFYVFHPRFIFLLNWKCHALNKPWYLILIRTSELFDRKCFGYNVNSWKTLFITSDQSFLCKVSLICEHISR